MKSIVVVCLFAIIATGCATPTPETTAVGPKLDLPNGWQAASASIVAEQLLADVTRLASDEFGGRLPGSEGDMLARAYLSDRLQEIGFEPAFDGAWQQVVEIVGVKSKMPDLWTFKSPDGNEVSFHFYDEYMGASGLQQSKVDIKDAEVVFVGYGIEAPEENWNDFKGVDLRGKVLLMLNDDPDWDETLFAGERKLSYGRWTYKYESAARQGAAAALIIHTTPSAGYNWGVVQASGSGEEFQLEAGDEPRVGIQGYLTEDAARRLVKLSGHELDELVAAARSREFQPVPLKTTTSINFEVDVRQTQSGNVGGILRGSDPDLSDEILVLSAHHDHFGIGAPDETGDTIYNGALDNGVAMAQALSVAHAFTQLPERPRRSIMVLFVTCEEQGILGSNYFVHSGVYHPGTFVANINFELGNVWGKTRDVIIYGKGKSELDDLLIIAAQMQNRVVTAETDVRAGWFYRSDQISFAQVGVPAIWFKSGVDFIGQPEGWGEQQYRNWIDHHYHQPADEVDASWVFDGLVEDAQLAFMLGSSLVTSDGSPSWYLGDEFYAVRQKALAELASATH